MNSISLTCYLSESYPTV